MALALLALSELAYWRAVQGLDEVRRRVDIGAEVQSLLTSVAEAESGEWGYWRTGRPQMLHHVLSSRMGIDAAWVKLPALTAQQAPELQSEVQHLHALVQARLAAWDARRDGRQTEPPPAEQMDAIRSLSMQIVGQQRQLAAARRADLLEGLWLSRVALAALLAVTLLAVALSRRHAAAWESQREEKRRAVQVERDRLERLVEQRTEELTELTRHLEWAGEEARDRLAGTLHDEVGALLTSAKLDAARLKVRLASPDGEAVERLAHLMETLDRVITLKRRLIEDLRPSALQHLGLVPALEALLADFSRRTGLPVQATLTPLPLAADVALTGYRVVQEALDNVALHAHARAVTVRLQPGAPGSARLEVCDDGQGFDPAQRSAISHGLVGLRYRVQAVHGQWRVTAAPGQGTCVAASLPLIGRDIGGDIGGDPCQEAPTRTPAGS